MTVVFVCTGNSCRSPMAAAGFDRYCRRRNLKVEVVSAGIEPAGIVSKHAIDALARFGIKPLTLKTRRLDAVLVHRADLIVAMTHAHVEWIRREFPEAADNTHTLSDFDHFHGDVPDPIGTGLDTYMQVFEIMKPNLEALAERLANNADPLNAPNDNVKWR